MTIATTRELDAFGVPAHPLAATGAAFEGRTATTRRRTPATVGIAPSAGFRTRVLVGATRLSRGTSMI